MQEKYKHKNMAVVYVWKMQEMRGVVFCFLFLYFLQLPCVKSMTSLKWHIIFQIDLFGSMLLQFYIWNCEAQFRRVSTLYFSHLLFAIHVASA